MKLCLASMAPFMSGAEVALERLSLGLQQAGHDVFLLLGTPGVVLDRLSSLGLRCQYSPMVFTDRWHFWRYWSARNRLRRIIRREAPDIVHSNDLPTHQILSDAAQGTGIPRICHHRFYYDGTCVDWLNKFGAERHIFVSRSLMDDLVSQSKQVRNSSRTVIYDGLPIPPLPTAEDRSEARRKLGLPLERVIVLFVGQIIELKGVADLLRAWSLLPSPLQERAELILVGDDLQKQGAYRSAMENLARELRCSSRFVGFQKNVQEWQMACDIAVVPSHVEPLGTVVLEAMCLGVAVVGCSVGGIREVVVDRRTGLLVPPRSPEALSAALTRLIGDAELRRQLGEQGRRRCEDIFGLEAHVGAVVKEYQSVLSSRQEAAVS